MEHLQKEFGNTTRIPVRRLAQQDSYNPSGCGYTFTYFHRFPSLVSWTFDNDGQLIKEPGASINSRGELLQTWLFFGLAYTVVQKDGQPLLTFEQLVQEGEHRWLSTGNLTDALQQWASWEIDEAQKDPARTRMRLIRISLALDKAKLIIRRYCSFDKTGRWKDDEKYSLLPDDEEYMTDEEALALMLLGEALESVKKNVVKKIQRSIPGIAPGDWHKDDDPGWGQPRYVIEKMKEDGWCPRNIYLLRRQLGLQATLFLNAYLSHQQSVQLKRNEHRLKGCDTYVCKVMSEISHGERTVYTTAHHDQHCREDGPRWTWCTKLGPKGPDMDDVNRILDKDSDNIFPLVRFKRGSECELEVLESNKNIKYVTISHVWSDGYGNRDENRLRPCQLMFIKAMLRCLKSDDKDRTAFWMDTLVIPVGQDEDVKKRRKKAIRQIFSVFSDSQCSIVLDRALVNMTTGTNHEPCLTGLQIISSGWMRRLWTLQEAHLSRDIAVAFSESGGTPLKHVEELRRAIREQSEEHWSITASRIHIELDQNIMWKRDIRASNELCDIDDELYTSPRRNQGRVRMKSAVIAAAWRAARWRATSNSAHETLALETLLGLQATDLALSAENVPWEESRGIREIEKFMVQFWEKVHKEYPGAIPAGIIFLPKIEDRINSEHFPGFGWSPYTFMKPEEITAPDPLSQLLQSTVLKKQDPDDDKKMAGLVVECPGYLLHVDNRKEFRKPILSTTESFKFPVNTSFIEWYQSEPMPDSRTNEWAEGVSSRNTQLAIIISSPSPREEPAEIGLLVEIYHEIKEDSQSNIFCAQILFRVRLRKLHVPREEIPEYMISKSDSAIYGEALLPSQKWCVDGYNPQRFPSLVEPTAVPVVRQRIRLAAMAYMARNAFRSALG